HSVFVSYYLSSPPHLPSFPTRRSSDLAHGAQHTALGAGSGGDAEAAMQPFGSEYGCGFRHGRAPARRRGCSEPPARWRVFRSGLDRKSTRLNSSHVKISYAVFCLKKKK